MHLRTLPSTAIVALAATLLSATVAAAHPALRPNEVPAGTTVEAELVVPHGCAAGGGMPDDAAAASPTTELSLQLVDPVIVTAEAVAGWDVSSEGEVVTWRDAGGATTDAIILPVEVTVAPGAAVDEPVFLPAYQECENGESFRWVALPDEDGWPAVRLTPLAAGAAPGTVAPTAPAHDMDMGGEEMSTDMPTEDAPAAPESVIPEETTATPVAEAAGQAVGDEDGGIAWWAWGLGVLVLAGGAFAWARRRGPA